jgi:hypothetical protein
LRFCSSQDAQITCVSISVAVALADGYEGDLCFDLVRLLDKVFPVTLGEAVEKQRDRTPTQYNCQPMTGLMHIYWCLFYSKMDQSFGCVINRLLAIAQKLELHMGQHNLSFNVVLSET